MAKEKKTANPEINPIFLTQEEVLALIQEDPSLYDDLQNDLRCTAESKNYAHIHTTEMAETNSARPANDPNMDAAIRASITDPNGIETNASLGNTLENKIAFCKLTPVISVFFQMLTPIDLIALSVTSRNVETFVQQPQYEPYGFRYQEIKKIMNFVRGMLTFQDPTALSESNKAVKELVKRSTNWRDKLQEIGFSPEFIEKFVKRGKAKEVYDRQYNKIKNKIGKESFQKFLTETKKRKKLADDAKENLLNMADSSKDIFEKIRNDLIKKIPRFICPDDSVENGISQNLKKYSSDSDLGFIAIIKALKHLDKNSNYFLLKLDHYPHAYANLILERALESPEAFGEMIRSLDDLERLALQFPTHIDCAIRQLLENTKAFDLTIYNPTVLKDLVKFFPEYTDTIAKHLLEKDEDFARLVAHHPKGFKVFQEIFPFYVDQAKEKLLSLSFQQYLKEYLQKKDHYFQKPAEVKNFESASFIDFINLTYDENGYNTMVFSIQNDDHHDNRHLYDGLSRNTNFYLPSSYYCEITLRKNEKSGIFVVSFRGRHANNPGENSMIEKNAREKLIALMTNTLMPKFCPTLSVTTKKLMKNPATTLLDIKEWEEKLRKQFSDPDLRLVRVAGESGGSIRLLVVNPDIAKKIIPHLSKSVFKNISSSGWQGRTTHGYKVDEHQMDIPFSKLSKFKNALDKLAPTAVKESKSISTSHITNIQNAWMTEIGTPITIKTMLPDGKESRILLELDLKIAACFWHVMHQEMPNLHGINGREFSLPLEQWNEIVNPQKCQRILEILEKITEIETDLCRWNTQNDSNLLIQTIEADDDGMDGSIFGLQQVGSEDPGIPMNYDVLCVCHESMKRKYSTPPAESKCSSRDSSPTSMNLVELNAPPGAVIVESVSEEKTPAQTGSSLSVPPGLANARDRMMFHTPTTIQARIFRNNEETISLNNGR